MTATSTSSNLMGMKGPDGLHGDLDQLIGGFGGIDVDVSLGHGLLDPGRRMRSLGLRIDGISGYELDDLTAFVLDELPALLRRQADLALFYYGLGNGQNIRCPEGLL